MKTAKLLIVDDEASIRQIIKDIFEDEGNQVLEARNVAEAIHILDQTNLDLMILDIQMSGMDGLEFLEFLATRRKNFEIIMISGHGTIENAVKAIKIGAFDFLSKPLSLEKLKSTVAGALQKKEISSTQSQDPGITNFLPNFRIIREISQGGFAVIYEALQVNLQKPVALKILHAQYRMDPAILTRFEQEAKFLGSLKHPNIVEVYDMGHLKDCSYLSMELIRGESLDQFKKNDRKLSWTEYRELILQICDGLHHIHQLNIIHRDLKPSNILITEQHQIKITDFGIAYHTENALLNLTATGTVLGTPYFIAPELFDGEKPSPQSDVFSLGVLFYWLLTDHYPFSGKTPYEVMNKISEGQITRPSFYLPSIHPDLESLINNCLETDKNRRVQTVHQIKEAMLHIPSIN